MAVVVVGESVGGCRGGAVGSVDRLEGEEEVGGEEGGGAGGGGEEGGLILGRKNGV